MLTDKINKGWMILEKLFQLKANGTTVRTELLAGLTTFLAMAYILAVNPSILADSGMPREAIFAATAVSAAFATMVMAFFANYPVVLASGMGLNAYFAYTVVPQLAAQGVTEPWRVALTAILVEGVIFVLLSFVKFRETLVNKVPENLKRGISAGIGLFVVFVGLRGARIVDDDPANLISFGKINSPEVVLALLGIMLIAVFWHYKVKGAILLGIAVTWILGIIAEVTGWYHVDPAAGVYSVIPDFEGYSVFAPLQTMATQTVCQLDFGYILTNPINFMVVVFAFLFTDLFDTVGTLIGVAQECNMLNEKGELPRVGRALMADAVGTVVGAIAGTSTVTSYVESTTGVAAGGRTGLTALTSAVLFLLSLTLYPIFLAVPSFATAPALVFVGLLMVKNITKMKFDEDIADTVGGFFAIVMMPFANSIAAGIMFAIISWVILKVATGKIREVHPVLWVAFGLFAVRVVTMVLGVAS